MYKIYRLRSSLTEEQLDTLRALSVYNRLCDQSYYQINNMCCWFSKENAVRKFSKTPDRNADNRYYNADSMLYYNPPYPRQYTPNDEYRYLHEPSDYGELGVIYIEFDNMKLVFDITSNSYFQPTNKDFDSKILDTKYIKTFESITDVEATQAIFEEVELTKDVVDQYILREMLKK